MAYSATAIGAAFERHALKFLNYHLDMSLVRVGGRGDAGIDLRGWWWLPRQALREQPTMASTSTSVSPLAVIDTDTPIGHTKSPVDRKGKRKAGPFDDLVRLRIVGQCKALSKKVAPRDVRELEGVMAGLKLWHLNRSSEDVETDTDDDFKHDSHLPSIAILISQSGFSREAVSRALTSPAPMMLVHLPGGRSIPMPALDGEGPEGKGMKVNGCLWNTALSGDKGLFSDDLALRREILGGESGDDKVTEQWRVWYRGTRLGRVGPPLERTEDTKA